jgi:hypothetical protein
MEGTRAQAHSDPHLETRWTEAHMLARLLRFLRQEEGIVASTLRLSHPDRQRMKHGGASDGTAWLTDGMPDADATAPDHDVISIETISAVFQDVCLRTLRGAPI